MSLLALGVLGRGLVDPASPVLLADDLGLQRGDGCFETVLVRAKGPGEPTAVRLDAHLERLAHSAVHLDLPVPDEPAWRSLVRDVLDRDPVGGEAVLKLIITRGPSVEGSETGIITLSGVPATVARQRAAGVDVVTLDRGVSSDAFGKAPWLLGGVKTISYALNMAALRQAARRGADDAIFVSSDGLVLEAPTASVLWWAHGRLVTTSTDGTGILAGTTQQAVFEAARDRGLETGYGLITPDGLRRAEAVWLASSIRGLTPVRTLDGHPVRQHPTMTRELGAVAVGASS
jgi:4-amino-4-deoxychorismate lyase